MAIFFGATMAELVSGGESVDHNKMIAAGARILLRMNPNDPDYKALSNASKIQMDYVFNPSERVINLPEESDHFVAVSQRILKREWERLKTDIQIESDARK